MKKIKAILLGLAKIPDLVESNKNLATRISILESRMPQFRVNDQRKDLINVSMIVDASALIESAERIQHYTQEFEHKLYDYMHNKQKGIGE